MTGRLFAQQEKVDSMVVLLKRSHEDTNKVNLLNELSYECYRIGQYDKEMSYAREALKLAKQLNWKQGEASALTNIGGAYDDVRNYTEALKYVLDGLKIYKEIKDNKGIAASENMIGAIYYRQGFYTEALEHFSRSVEVRKKTGDNNGLADAYNNISNVYRVQGNYPQALHYLTSSLKIYEKSGDQKGTATAHNNIGVIYNTLNDYPKAIEHLEASLKLRQRLGNKYEISDTYSNIGNVYANQNKYGKAIEYYLKTLALAQELNDLDGIAIVYANLGAVNTAQHKYQEALNNYMAALKLREKIQDKYGAAICYTSMGTLNVKLNNIPAAFNYQQKAIAVSKELGAKDLLAKNYLALAQLDSITCNYKNAFDHYKTFVAYRDSIDNEENVKKQTQIEMQYAFDKKQATDSISNAKQKEVQDAKIARKEAELKASRNQQYALFGGLALVLVFAALMYNRFRITKKQKTIIESQKTEVEKKNKEVTDSITYAKRIQEAILPSQNTLNSQLRNGFVLYKPKDIVAGDFYWLEKYNNTIYFAAADCTGHGVPGAMVSVVCSNALSKALLEEGITDTGKLLDRTRELVIQRFDKNGEDVKDGMDISVCALNGMQLQWSGANNPLWIIKNNGSLTEIKPDKQPIGKYSDARPFAAHTITLESNDTVYIFTDGYQDQFGGEKGKKFKASALKELLLSIQDKSMTEQKSILDITFKNWRGQLEQLDDVCVIGLRIM